MRHKLIDTVYGVSYKKELTVVYGSLESVVVPMSGMKGGWPAVDQNVCFAGKAIPKAN